MNHDNRNMLVHVAAMAATAGALLASASASVTAATQSEAEAASLWYQAPGPSLSIGDFDVFGDGRSVSLTFGGPFDEDLLRSYTATGDLAWKKSLPTGPSGVCAHPSGEITVMRNVATPSSLPGLFEVEVRLKRFDADGNEVSDVGLGNTMVDRGSLIVSDGEDVWIAGVRRPLSNTLPSFTNHEVYLRRVNALGQEVSFASLSTVPHSSGLLQFVDLEVGLDGNAVALAVQATVTAIPDSGSILRVDAAGQLTETQFDDAFIPYEIAPLPGGLSVVAGINYPASSSCRLFDAAMQELWRYDDLTSGAGLAALTIDAGGDVLYCSGSPNTVFATAFVPSTIVRLAAATGAVIDTKILRRDPRTLLFPVDFRTDAANNLFARTVPYDEFTKTFDNVGVSRVSPIVELGVQICVGEVNSSGSSGTLSAAGSLDRAQNRLALYGSGLPGLQPVLLLVSDQTGSIAQLGGGMGTLCLGGAIGRYNGPGQVYFGGGEGVALFEVDLDVIPRGSSFVSGINGQTWYFQAWHRDSAAFLQSNLTSAVGVTLE